MDYILANENNNFSVDAYFTPPLRRIAFPAVFPPRAKAQSKAHQATYTASLRSKLGCERSDRLHKARENHIITI